MAAEDMMMSSAFPKEDRGGVRVHEANGRVALPTENSNAVMAGSGDLSAVLSEIGDPNASQAASPTPGKTLRHPRTGRVLSADELRCLGVHVVRMAHPLCTPTCEH